MYDAHVRGERAAGAEREAAARAERELRVALGLLLVRDCQHALVAPGLDVVSRDDAGRAADGTGGVDAEHRLARSAERVGQVQLRLHDAFEEVGRLADDDRVDVRPVHLGVFERARRCLTHQAAERDVPAARLVLGLADANDCTGLVSHQFLPPSRMQTRFCCRHGPDVECASVRGFPLSRICPAASAIRTRPVAMMGFDDCGPPEGLMMVSLPRPSAETSSGSSWVNADWISATSIGPSSMPAALAASVVEFDVLRSRMPG